jgi:hypothetical protein
MRGSTGAGNECTGVNDGSKNSVLVTYLADAWARGAELFCGINVRHVKKKERCSGYTVFYETSSERGGKIVRWVNAVSIYELFDARLRLTQHRRSSSS